MSRAELIADLAYAADCASQAYDIAQARASELNSKTSGEAALRAYRAKVKAQKALAAAQAVTS